MALEVGLSGLKEQPIRKTVTVDRTTFVVPMIGATADVTAAESGLIGSEIPGEFVAVPVESYEIEELGGDQSKITMHLSVSHDTGAISSDPIGDPVYEIDWQELQKPLETHGRCGKLKPDRPGIGTENKQRTWDDWTDLTTADYDATGTGVWTLAEYKALREAGIESFSVGFPIVRRTIFYYRNPSDVGEDCFRPETPPVAANAPTESGGFALFYLKGTDKITKEGRLRTRNTEWIGAWVVPALIYGT